MATGLQVSVGADTTEFRQEIRELPKEFEKAEQEIVQSVDHVNSALDGIAKGLLQSSVPITLERIIDQFDKVADAASKYGQSAEDIQRVGSAAEMTGSNLDIIAGAMERAGVAAAKAARGNEEFVEKFNRAGIDAAAFSTASLTERIDMVAKAQQEAGTSGDRHAAILEALGEATTSIDFQRIADEMQNVAVASNETVAQLSRAKDTMDAAQKASTVFAADGLGVIADYAERLGNILGEGDGGLIGKLQRWIRFSAQFTPAAGVANMLGLGGQTNRELDDMQKRLNAIALLRSRDGISNASEEQIKAEMDAIVEREKEATKATNATNDAIDKGKEKTDKNSQIKQRLLEISLQLKEAEAANNTQLAQHLRYQEDLYKGILKYKDAEDAYGMAVREANAELAKRKDLTGGKGIEDIVAIRQGYIEATRGSAGLSSEEEAKRQEAIKKYFDLTRQNPELLRFDVQAKLSELAKQGVTADPIKRAIASLVNGGGVDRSMRAAGMTEPERQRAEAVNQASAPASEADKIATETTLQKVAKFLEELNTKLPQPVLV